MPEVSFEALSTEQSWAKRLGLLPVPLYAHRPSHEFVMLNGSQGNFCLALTPPTMRTGRDIAWSTDVGHYLFLDRSRVIVERWDQQTREEIALQAIADDVDRFRKYLERTDPRTDASIVTHVMTAFGLLRNILGEEFNAEQSVRALLVALAALDCAGSPSEIPLSAWGISEQAEDVVNAIPEASWDNVMSFLRGEDHGLVAVPELLLRHAAGRVFQEANYVVQLPPQMSLPGVEVTTRLAQVGNSMVGVYYTPPALARTMVEQSLKTLDVDNLGTIRVFDPACGSGEFLRESVRQIGLRHPTASIELIGFDISSIACEMTRFALAAEQRQNPALSLSVNIRQANALLERWPTSDLVVMNPPFVEYRSLTAEQKSNLAAVLTPDELSFRSDLSMAFLALACASLSSKGVLASLMPASLLEGDSAARLRSERMADLDLRLIAKLGNQYAFSKVKVDAAILVASRTRKEDETTFVWADHRRESLGTALRELRKDQTTPREGEGYSIYVKRVHSAEELMPRPLSALDAFDSYKKLPRAGELFDVRQGVLTGHNEAFLIAASYYEELPPRERRFFRPAVVNASLLEGRIRDVQYVFYPYGRQSVESEEELHRRVPRYYQERLLPSRQAILRRSRVKADRWWLLTEARVALSTEESKLVSTYFGDRGSFGWDADGKYTVVQGYAWLPKTGILKASFSSARALGYLSILNSALFGKLLQSRATHVAGGQLNLSKRYVSEIPLPDLFSSDVPPDLLAALADCGRQIWSGSPDWERVDEFSQAAYDIGLPIAL